MLLEVNDVTKAFGGILAVRGVSINIQEGTLSSIIGPNGAGKTTFFNLLTGIYKPDSGSILFNGRSIVGLRPDQVNAVGIARTFQSIRLFPSMTVIENVMVGMNSRLNISLWDTLARTGRFREQEERVRVKSGELLRFVGLAGKGDEVSRNLSYGDQRRVEIARALASDPKLLLLDEPTAGMNPIETEALGTEILELRQKGLAVLVIEHDMALIHQVCDEIYVLNFGQIIAHGTPNQIKNNPLVIEAYLGEEG